MNRHDAFIQMLRGRGSWLLLLPAQRGLASPVCFSLSHWVNVDQAQHRERCYMTKHRYQIQQVLYLRVRNKYRKLASRFFLGFVFRKVAGIMKVGELDPI